ncbi:tegument host shut-off protein [Equid alphaherpesvirus 3]|uniref:Virion host shutoff protein n=1 Tax=Equid alphaherpesvirus 3 TaxID=80341 RepID=A0A077B9P1_9ALPH|nr:tegument host shut-off protein [Equid alphaherpesvirus 3]AIL02936.1 tegument host shut-off protein [Equid alphaherpesvirus 3]
MGLFGLLKYAYSNRLVKHDAITTPPGVMTPIAIDLWNVMYTLMEKFASDEDGPADSATATARCFFSLLRLLLKRSYYPIFVSDRGIHGDGHVKHGAKAIVTQTMSRRGGSGRLPGGPCLAGEGDEADLLEAYASEGGCGAAVPGAAPENAAQGFGEPARRPEQSQPPRGAPGGAPRLSYRLCVNLIRYLGYPYVNAVDLEADDVCANLYHTNTVAQVYTTDTDLILMGCDIILDATPLFPPTLRCCDVLMSLGMGYDEFLTQFVRCHTDLHQQPTLVSVQTVIRSLAPREGDVPDDERAARRALGFAPFLAPGPRRSIEETCDSWRRPTGATFSSRSAPAPPPESYATARLSGRVGRPEDRRAPRRLSEPPEDRRGARRSLDPTTRVLHLKYTSRYPPIMESAPRALALMHPPRTRHEVLERKFVKHVVAMLTPEIRGRFAVLRRMPIIQEDADFGLVYETLKNLVPDPDTVKELANLFWNHVPTPPDYNTVLVNYWDECRSRRCRPQ